MKLGKLWMGGGAGMALLLLAGYGVTRWMRSRSRQIATNTSATPPPADEVNEASAESFPASDAPSWTPTSANVQ